MIKILTVLGARPQFIKASVVSAAFSRIDGVNEILVHTGQHHDANMSDVFFSELAIPSPQHHLGIHGGLHGAMTGKMLDAIEQVLLQEQPDAVLVYGDTNSTLAGALAAVKLHIPVAHVEAGLRSFNRIMPEEINRILTDRISCWLFTPTEAAAQHLRNEGVTEKQIIPVGDVMYDVALHFGARVSKTGRILERLALQAGRYVLATVHRAENTDNFDRLQVIVDALLSCAKILPVVWPVHPRTHKRLQEFALLPLVSAAGVFLIDPAGYLDMVQLEKFAALVVTDSGGVQKEAFFHRVPCVTLRDETEWGELVDLGWNRLAPPSDACFLSRVIENALGTRGDEASPYGNGKAADKIAEKLTMCSKCDSN